MGEFHSTNGQVKNWNDIAVYRRAATIRSERDNELFLRKRLYSHAQRTDRLFVYNPIENRSRVLAAENNNSKKPDSSILADVVRGKK